MKTSAQAISRKKAQEAQKNTRAGGRQAPPDHAANCRSKRSALGFLLRLLRLFAANPISGLQIHPAGFDRNIEDRKIFQPRRPESFCLKSSCHPLGPRPDSGSWPKETKEAEKTDADFPRDSKRPGIAGHQSLGRFESVGAQGASEKAITWRAARRRRRIDQSSADGAAPSKAASSHPFSTPPQGLCSRRYGPEGEASVPPLSWSQAKADWPQKGAKVWRANGTSKAPIGARKIFAGRPDHLCAFLRPTFRGFGLPVGAALCRDAAIRRGVKPLLQPADPRRASAGTSRSP